MRSRSCEVLDLRRRLIRVEADHPAAQRAITLWLRLGADPVSDPAVEESSATLRYRDAALDLLDAIDLRQRLLTAADDAEAVGALHLAVEALRLVLACDQCLRGRGPAGWRHEALELLDGEVEGDGDGDVPWARLVALAHGRADADR